MLLDPSICTAAKQLCAESAALFWLFRNMQSIGLTDYGISQTFDPKSKLSV